MRIKFDLEATTLLTNITPHRRPVYRITIPDDRVDKLVEAGKPCPDHVETGACVPSLQVPGEGDSAHEEAEEGEGGEDSIGISHV